MAALHFVFVKLCFELVQTTKLNFIANAVYKKNAQALAVNFFGEIKNVHFGC